MEVLLFMIALVPSTDASQRAWNGKSLELESRAAHQRESSDSRRAPLLRQEHSVPSGMASNSLEISSKGRVHSSPKAMGLAQQGEQHRRQPAGLNHSEVDMPEDGQKFEMACDDYPRCTDQDCADPVSTGEFMCNAGEDENGEKKCLKDQYVEAGDRCCSCGGGAQFRNYEDTQCMGGSGLSRSGNYDGKDFSNPQVFLPGDGSAGTVLDCMNTCWAMGEDCTAFSVVNEGDKNFAGKCFFRKGALKYIHGYSDCLDSTCQQRKSDPDVDTNTPEPTTTTIFDNDTRLVFCDDEAKFENIPCTDNPAEARPKTHTTTAPPPTQDDVVDKRDCFVKYLWWR